MITQRDIYSMTGYAYETMKLENVLISCEAKSLNHRYRDIFIHLPEKMYKFEEKISSEISKKFLRGKYNFYLNLEFFDGGNLLDVSRIKEHLNYVKKVKNELKLSGEIDIGLLFSSLEMGLADQIPELSWDNIEDIVVSTLKHLKDAQEKEGVNLKKICVDNIDTLSKLWSSLKERSKDLTDEIRERLTETITSNYKSDYDENRLAQEIVYFAEKSNITEEIDRLNSHISYFNDVITEGSPCGKKLNFITQEMFRETETISSKSSNLEITQLTVEMKNLIENLREQVQNIM